MFIAVDPKTNIVVYTTLYFNEILKLKHRNYNLTASLASYEIGEFYIKDTNINSDSFYVIGVSVFDPNCQKQFTIVNMETKDNLTWYKLMENQPTNPKLPLIINTQNINEYPII